MVQRVKNKRKTINIVANVQIFEAQEKKKDEFCSVKKKQIIEKIILINKENIKWIITHLHTYYMRV